MTDTTLFTTPVALNFARDYKFLPLVSLCLFILYISVNANFTSLNKALLTLSGSAYGPSKFVLQSDESSRNADITAAKSAYLNIDLKMASSLTHNEFRGLILNSVPLKMRKRLTHYLDDMLYYSKKYKVDPFWVIAVAWTESHFKQSALSHVSASGLMQIMPKTGHFLSRLLKRPISESHAKEIIKDPAVNIEMGTFYLSRLLRTFRGSSRLATVAYNMGPTGVKRRLRAKREVGVKNHYLNKVRRHYTLASRLYRDYIKKTSILYKKTLVVKYPVLSYHLAGVSNIDKLLIQLEFFLGRKNVAFN